MTPNTTQTLFGQPADPLVIFFNNDTSAPETAQLDIACRYYGFCVATIATAPEVEQLLRLNDTGSAVLLAVTAAALTSVLPAVWRSIEDLARNKRIPIAVVGIDSGTEPAIQTAFAINLHLYHTPAQSSAAFWSSATELSNVGYELRGIRLAMAPGSVTHFEFVESPERSVLGRTGVDESSSLPSLVRIEDSDTATYLLARTSPTEPTSTWQYNARFFGEVAPFFILVREVGGVRCWQPTTLLANLTIDDPWLTEPYGSLSFSDLLQQMRTERFHATIGFIPWNYDRYSPDVAALVRDNPAFFSVAIHGNNHDRYEFFRYTARPGDLQRPKPLEKQAFNIRQAMGRMQQFEKSSGVAFDRVMVFPHGISPGPTLEVLKKNGFWATFNYNNVPLDEKPPTDPAQTLRSAYTNWFGFPAFRRNYPHNYVEESIAIDLFLGNPVLFMAHQDTFFDGIDAFTAMARRVNTRQPSVQWASLGEVSRRYYLVRWLDETHSQVRMFARHALVENRGSASAECHIQKSEPVSAEITGVTVDGVEVPWSYSAGKFFCTAKLKPTSTALVEVHYQPLADAAPVSLHRRGLRNRTLRAIADFRDLTLPRSFLGRFLTRKYYRPGKKRATFSSLFTRSTAFLRPRPASSVATKNH